LFGIVVFGIVIDRAKRSKASRTNQDSETTTYPVHPQKLVRIDPESITPRTRKLARMKETSEESKMIDAFLHTTRLQWELTTAKRHYAFWNGIMWERIDCPNMLLSPEAQDRLVVLARDRKDQARDNVMYLTKQISEDKDNQHV
jgi:hypothetical protein